MLRRLKKRFNESKYDEVVTIMKQHSGVFDIIRMKDKKSFTILHRMVLHQNADDLIFAYNYALHRETGTITAAPPTTATQDSRRFQEWVNAQNDEGTTALHLAGFMGNVTMMQFLVSIGADPHIKNTNGLSGCHIAAQGDQPISLCYLFSIGCDLSILDGKGGTVLHWACYLGCENSVNFILSIMPSITNTKDSEGLGPLSLAVLSGNARVVKKLLQRGADRFSSDSNNKTPSDLAREQKFENIEQMLDSSEGWEEYCNIKQPFKPLNKSAQQVVIFACLFLFVQTSNIAFIFPFFDELFLELTVWGSLNLLTLFGFVSAWLRDPGSVSGILRLPSVSAKLPPPTLSNSSSQTSSSHNNNGVYEQLLSPDIKESIAHQRCDALLPVYEKCGDHSRICVECCLEKPKRSRHCEICKKCVRVYDHHCPWINNCVGASNHRFFITFIVSLWLNLFSTIVFVSVHIANNYENITFHVFNWYEHCSEDQLQIVAIAKYIACGISLIIAFFFLALHTVLCYIQISNLLLNQTTFERYNRHSKKDQSHIADDMTLMRQSFAKRSSLMNSTDLSSINPSLIVSHPMHTTQSVKAVEEENEKKKNTYGCYNAYTMCFLNRRNIDLDNQDTHQFMQPPNQQDVNQQSR